MALESKGGNGHAGSQVLEHQPNRQIELERCTGAVDQSTDQSQLRLRRQFDVDEDERHIEAGKEGLTYERPRTDPPGSVDRYELE